MLIKLRKAILSSSDKMLPLLVAHFATDAYSSCLPVFIPFLMTKFDLSLALAGVLTSIYMVGSSLTQPLFGYLGDRWSRANFVVLGPLLAGLFMSLVGPLPSYGLVTITLLLAGLGVSMFHPQATAQAGLLFSSSKGLSLSIFITAGTLGFALGPLLMGALIAVARFDQTYLAIIPPLAILPWLYMTTRTDKSASTALESKRLPVNLWKSFQLLAPLWLIVVLRSVVYFSLNTFLLVLLKERGVSYFGGSISLFMFLLAGTLGTLGGGYLSDRFGRKRVIVLSLLLAFPALWGFLHLPGVLSFVLLAVSGALLYASNPVIVAQAQELAPRNSGMASAITMGFAWGMAGLLVGLVGHLGDLIGLAAALDIVIYGVLLAAVLAFIVRYPQRTN
ncbi:MFS transporter [Candidatus Acetothermia bacterium]|nr:MFS transporter [Candidatus Acetothermia bacterium]